MTYLRLSPSCRLVKGRRLACLYDLSGGGMYGLGELEWEFLGRALRGETEEELLASRTEAERTRLAGFVVELGKIGLAAGYDQPYHVGPLRKGLGADPMIFLHPTRLTAFHLEISQECVLDCRFCRPEALIGRGTGCGRYQDGKGSSLDLARRLELISQAKELGAKSLMLTGGDSLLSPDWRKLVSSALELGYDTVVLQTTGLGLEVVPEDWLGDRRVRFSLQVHSPDESVHATMVGRSGTLAPLLANLERLAGCRSDPYLALVVGRVNEAGWRQSQAFFQRFTEVPVRIVPLFPSGEGEDSPSDPSGALLGVRKWFMPINPYALAYAEAFHPCFHGRLAVTGDGRILPCPSGRNWTLGDAGREDLWQVLRDERHKPFWELAKSRLAKCRECEFRLGCFDCRVIQGKGESLTDVAFCDYDPGSGKWERR